MFDPIWKTSAASAAQVKIVLWEVKVPSENLASFIHKK